MSRVAKAIAGLIASTALIAAVMAAAEEQSAIPQAPHAKINVVKRPYDKQQLLSAPALPEPAYRGRTIWLQRCAYCHDGVGQPSYNTLGPWIDSERVKLLGEPAIRAIIGAGTERMPGFSYALKPQQMDDLIAFLKTVPASQKPTAAQLAGKAPGDASGD